jgi:hypothetical protein
MKSLELENAGMEQTKKAYVVQNLKQYWDTGISDMNVKPFKRSGGKI